MKSDAYKHLSPKSSAKHYSLIAPLVQVANLLPWSIRDGERYVEVSAHALPERELPSSEAIRNFPTSSVERLLLKDLSSAAVRRNQTELVKGRLIMVPSAS
jgi:hypothetical protein